MGPKPAYCIGRRAGLRRTNPPSFPLARIRPVIIRGQLCFAVGIVAFLEFRRAACAWTALEAQRLATPEHPEEPPSQRAEALTLMRRVGDTFAGASAMSRRPAQLSQEQPERLLGLKHKGQGGGR